MRSSKKSSCVITGVHLNILPSSDDRVVAIASLEINEVI